jgi:hypothetical protein
LVRTADIGLRDRWRLRVLMVKVIRLLRRQDIVVSRLGKVDSIRDHPSCLPCTSPVINRHHPHILLVRAGRHLRVIKVMLGKQRLFFTLPLGPFVRVNCPHLVGRRVGEFCKQVRLALAQAPEWNVFEILTIWGIPSLLFFNGMLSQNSTFLRVQIS